MHRYRYPGTRVPGYRYNLYAYAYLPLYAYAYAYQCRSRGTRVPGYLPNLVDLVDLVARGRRGHGVATCRCVG